VVLRDYFGTQDFMEPENMILSTYPLEVAREEGAVNKGDRLNDPHFYKRDCDGNELRLLPVPALGSPSQLVGC
jgi:hypothetical protein